MPQMSEDPTRGHPPLPPGQRLVEVPPVIHVGEVPVFDPATWNLRVGGVVEHPLRLAWRDVLGLPRVEVLADFHGGTGWSVRSVRWSGVPLGALVAACEPRPGARFLLARDAELYAASLPLEAALAADALLALELGGRPLEPERGGPLRLVVPSRYAWKSVKWVRSLAFLETDEPGFWESRGAHPDGDPWKEQRLA
jgi:DMSO/TMAO reductase YedYZ molybdopterin-dependent catalytic subunit